MIADKEMAEACRLATVLYADAEDDTDGPLDCGICESPLIYEHEPEATPVCDTCAQTALLNLARALLAAVAQRDEARDECDGLRAANELESSLHDGTRAELALVRSQYLLVADAVAESSTSPEDLAAKARATRAERDAARAWRREAEEQAATLTHEQGRLIAERDAARQTALDEVAAWLESRQAPYGFDLAQLAATIRAGRAKLGGG